MNFEEMLSKFDINLNKNQINLFNIYVDFLIEYNQKINLTSIKKREEIFEKHFLDSLFVTKTRKISGLLIDVGSGAGFPGIPLEIFNPEISLVLLESSNKKCEFLNQILLKLNIESNVICARAEDVSHGELREKFDFCTARAVAALNILCEFCLPFVKKGGIFIALKGKNYKIELKNSCNSIKKLGGKIMQINEFSLPSGGERAVIYIEKIKNTPKIYPRNNAKIKKEPL